MNILKTKWGKRLSLGFASVIVLGVLALATLVGSAFFIAHKADAQASGTGASLLAVQKILTCFAENISEDGISDEDLAKCIADATNPVVTPLSDISSNPATPSVGIVASGYSLSLSVTGGTAPYTWSISNGSLPDGLTLAPATGVISGVPSQSAVGTKNFTVRVADSSSPQKTKTRDFSIQTNNVVPPAPSAINPSSIPNGTVDSNYSSGPLSVDGGSAPITYRVTSGGMGAWGLSINPSTGVISGKSPLAGPFTIIVEAKDSLDRIVTKSYNINFNCPSGTTQSGTSCVSSPNVPALNPVSACYDFPANTPSLGPSYAYTPTSATTGDQQYTDEVMNIQKALNTRADTRIAATGTNSPGNENGYYDAATLAAVNKFQVNVVGIAATGNVGSLTRAAMNSFCNGTTPTTPTTPVDPNITAITPASLTLPSENVNSVYPATAFTAVGGTPPFTWSVVDGSLPVGLTLSAGGAITGTPTVAGTRTFKVRVVDSKNKSMTSPQNYSIEIKPASVTDVCNNIDGNQTSAPSNGKVETNGSCSCNATYKLEGASCVKDVVVVTPVGLAKAAMTKYNTIGYSQTEPEAFNHANQTSKTTEHQEMFKIVPRNAATFKAVKDVVGNWSDTSTWEGGVVPGADAKVYIPHGSTVVYDRDAENVSLKWVRVEGMLTFATEINTTMKVETIVVAAWGDFLIGDDRTGDKVTAKAKIIFADKGDIIQQNPGDVLMLSRGLISHGGGRIVGAEKTAYVDIDDSDFTSYPKAATDTITLKSTPRGWKIGDRVMIPSTGLTNKADTNKAFNEERVIKNLVGNVVTLDRALSYNTHSIPKDLKIHVPLINLDRNIELTSENPATVTISGDNGNDLNKPSSITAGSRRGHVMFMHNANVKISDAAFNNLGRTDARSLVTDPGSSGKIGEGENNTKNPRGRYALHFHRTFPDVKDEIQYTNDFSSSPKVTVERVIVNNSPKLGFVNHASNVDILNSVAYDAGGAGFFTEIGNEIGTWDGNIAVYTIRGRGFIEAGTHINDFSFEGSGFWMQGNRVKITNNRAFQSRIEGFSFFTKFGATGVSGNFSFCDTRNIPNGNFHNNAAIGANTALGIRKNCETLSGTNYYTNFKGVNISDIGINSDYSTNSYISNVKIWSRENPPAPYGSYSSALGSYGITSDGNARGVQLIAPEFRYFKVGIGYFANNKLDPNAPDHKIDLNGGVLDNTANILVTSDGVPNGVPLTITGKPKIGNKTPVGGDDRGNSNFCGYNHTQLADLKLAQTNGGKYTVIFNGTTYNPPAIGVCTFIDIPNDAITSAEPVGKKSNMANIFDGAKELVKKALNLILGN